MPNNLTGNLTAVGYGYWSLEIPCAPFIKLQTKLDMWKIWLRFSIVITLGSPNFSTLWTLLVFAYRVANFEKCYQRIEFENNRVTLLRRIFTALKRISNFAICFQNLWAWRSIRAILGVWGCDDKENTVLGVCVATGIAYRGLYLNIRITCLCYTPCIATGNFVYSCKATLSEWRSFVRQRT